MLDVEMLELIGRPGGFITLGGGKPPPRREEVFSRLITDGWTPRNPAFGAELDRLEMYTTRGQCLNPLIMEGDVVYVDHNAPPLPGDIVSFALSERAAAAQNADLPAFDARPCKPGDRWLKAYVPYCGMDLLYERYGHFMTATWAACENPEEIPRLSPVRNIRRDGRLLFLPDAFAGQIGANAATFAYTATAASTNVPLNNSVVFAITQTIGPYSFDATVVVTASGGWRLQTGANADSGLFSGSIGRFTPSYDNYKVLYKTVPGITQPASTTMFGSFAFEETFALNAGTTAQYELEFTGTTGFPATTTLTILSSVMKSEVIIR